MTQGTLTIRSAPTYSFQWSTNSLGSNLVESSGTVGLVVYGFDKLGQLGSTAGLNYEAWQVVTTGEVQFGFGFDVTKSMSISLPVNAAQVYMCFVEVDAHFTGMGWPGSVATSMLSATVPSISYEFDPLPEAHA